MTGSKKVEPYRVSLQKSLYNFRIVLRSVDEDLCLESFLESIELRTFGRKWKRLPLKASNAAVSENRTTQIDSRRERMPSRKTHDLKVI